MHHIMEPIVIAVIVSGSVLFFRWTVDASMRAAGSASIASADIPAELQHEASSLQTAWDLLIGAFVGKDPEAEARGSGNGARHSWKGTEDVIKRWYQPLLAIAKHWDNVADACRAPKGGQQAVHANRQRLYMLRWCFIMFHKTLEDAADSGTLDLDDNSNRTLRLRMESSREWLDKTYPVITTHTALHANSVTWSHQFASLRASGGQVAILVPGQASSTRVLYGTGPNGKRPGYGIIKHGQGGLPEVLSAPSHPLLWVTWWRNWSRRRRLQDFADWDMWAIIPAFRDMIPHADVPGKMEVRKGDCIKLATTNGSQVLARTTLAWCPKLVLQSYNQYDHTESTFVLK